MHHNIKNDQRILHMPQKIKRFCELCIIKQEKSHTSDLMIVYILFFLNPWPKDDQIWTSSSENVSTC